MKPELQRLFFRGKQLDDKYALYDYGVDINSLVEVNERVVFSDVKENKEEKAEVKDEVKEEPKASTSSNGDAEVKMETDEPKEEDKENAVTFIFATRAAIIYCSSNFYWCKR